MYLVFSYDTCYPSGGMGDCNGVFSDPHAAWDKAQQIGKYSATDYLRIVYISADGTYSDVWDRDGLAEHNSEFLKLVDDHLTVTS